MGKTETTLAEFALNFPTANIPADVMHLAKRCVMNSCGVALYATLDPAIEIMLDFLRADLREPGVTRCALEGIDVVFHLAADHGGRGYVDLHQAGPANNFFLDGLVFHEALRAKDYKNMKHAGWYIEDYHLLQGAREIDLPAPPPEEEDRDERQQHARDQQGPEEADIGHVHARGRHHGPQAHRRRRRAEARDDEDDGRQEEPALRHEDRDRLRARPAPSSTGALTVRAAWSRRRSGSLRSLG